MSTKTNFNVKVPIDPTAFPATDSSVIWDASSGSFALGTIGSDGITVISDPTTVTVNNATTVEFLNGVITNGGTGVAEVAYTLQGVTNNGFTTTQPSLFLSNQPLDYNGLNGIDATPGFRDQGGSAYTHVTPQEVSKPLFLLGIWQYSEYPQNYIIYDKSITIYPPDTDGDDTHDPP
jgi:hypothetical protein